MFKAFIALVVVLLAISFATAQDTHAEFKACEVCTFLVSELKTVAKQYEGKVTEAIKKAVCTRFGTLEPACNAFIDEYGKAALDMLIKKIEPKVVCQKLHLCDNADWFKYYFSAEDGEHLMEQLMLEAAKKNVPESTSCDICMFVVGEAERYINESEPEIHKALLRACGYLPPQLEGVCNTMVLMYGHQLIQYLLKHGNATVVCRQIRLCPKTETAPVVFKIPEALKNEQVKPESAGCDLCQFVVGYVEEYLSKNETEEKLIKTLEKACKALPGSYAAQCIAIVDEYVPYIIYYLKEKYPPKTVCQLIGLCEKAVPVVVVVEPKKENGMACSVCKYVISAIEAELGKNVTEEKIKKVLNKVCDQFPSVFRPQCHSFVETYTHVIIQELLKKVPPAEVCKKIGVCKDAVVEEKNDLKCSVCQYVITAVKAEIGKNETEDKIKAALNKVCDKIPGAFKTQCKAFVAEYTHIIIEMLLAKASPEEVCKAVGMCPKDALIPAIPILQPEDGPCPLCQFVVTQVVNELSKNATEEKIKETLKKICDKLPFSYKGPCKSLVDDSIHYIIEQIKKKATPEQVCKAIGACPKDAAIPIPQPEDGPSCALCQFVVTQVVNELGKNATEEKIKEALNKVCDKLPATFKGACKALVEEYTHVLIEQLLKKATPEQVCKAIGACPKAEVAVLPVQQEVHDQEDNSVGCSVCQFVVAQIIKEVGSNATEEKIKAALNKVCDKIPGVFKTACKSFVAEYTHVLIELLLKKATPEQVCKEIGVCPKDEVEAQIVPVVEPTPINGPICSICQFVISQIEKEIGKNATEEKIKAALNKVCDKIPGVFKTQCKAFVEQYTPIIIKELLKKANPEQVCKAIGVCTDFVAPVVVEVEQEEPEEPEAKDGQFCDLCIQLATYLEEFVKKNATSPEIIKALQKACDLIPAYKEQCKVLLPMMWQQMIEKLLKKQTPKVICKQLHLCREKEIDFSDMEGTNSGMCNGCKHLVEIANNYITKNSTEEQIIKFVQKGCDYFPAAYRPMCKLVVQEYGKQIIETLVSKVLEPEKVCKVVRACPKRAQSGLEILQEHGFLINFN